MKQSTPERVTSLTFAQYDPANYALDHDEGMKLSSMNRILLKLFNNDLYIFTLLVGKMKGLWWKYWFADDAVKGYAAGDMVCSNGIQEMGFMKKYWSSIKQIADYGVVINQLPRFNPSDEEVVAKYINALTDYFHLGNRGLERQIYVSLKDNNKDVVTITDAWQPYIVTAEELQRREYQLSDSLEEGIQQHNAAYHTGLDILDALDSAYEVDNEPTSIYNAVLGTYLPKVRIPEVEHENWVTFAAPRKGASDKILGLGTVAYDFLHIIKPLGTATHHLETWVRTDGHVTVKGYVPVAMLTEIVPEMGTLEYNKWKMGGSRRYGMRLDYNINDTVSKLFFAAKKEETSEEDEDTAGLGKRAPVVKLAPIKYSRDDSREQEYEREFERLNHDMQLAAASMASLEEQLAAANPLELDSHPSFPSANDYWCKAANMIYPEGGFSTSLIEGRYLRTKEAPFLFNPDKVCQGDSWLIAPSYKASNDVVGLINVKQLLSDIDDKTRPEWQYYTVNVNTKLKYPKSEEQPADRYEHHVVISFNNLTTAQLESLIDYHKDTVKQLTTSTGAADERTLGDLLAKCVDSKFTISRYETELVSEEQDNHTFWGGDYDTRYTPPRKIMVTGKLIIQYPKFKTIEATATLLEVPPSDVVRVEDVVDDSNQFTDRVINDVTEDQANRIYEILHYTPNISGTVIFYNSHCDFPFEELIDHPEVLEPGHLEILTDLLDKEKYSHKLKLASNGLVEMHSFLQIPQKKDIEVEPPAPVSTVGEDTDVTTVASDVRLIRNFGIRRSPALKHISKAVVFPDVGDLVTPAHVSAPTISINNWMWTNGQSIVFEVPTSTQNISFEVDGMLKEDNIDFSVYDICKEKDHIHWVYDLVLNYDFPKAILEAALDEGIETDRGYPQLIGNMDVMMSHIERYILDYPVFTTFMQLRSLDIGPLNSLLQQLRAAADVYLQEDEESKMVEFQEAARILLRVYTFVYEYIAEHLRYGAPHNCFAELLSGAVTINQNRLVLLNQLRNYLIRHQLARPIDYYGQAYDATKRYKIGDYCLYDNELYRCLVNMGDPEAFDPTHWELVTLTDRGDLWIAEVEALIEVAENQTVDLVKGNHDMLATQFNRVLATLRKMHSAYVARREVELRPLDSLPNLDPESPEYVEAREECQKRTLENFQEVEAYLTEVDDSLTSAQEMRTKIQDYLAVDWLDDSTRAYLVYQLARLDDTMRRYKKMNLNICLGYDKYVVKWMDIFDIEEGTPLKEGQLGYTVHDLLYGTGGMRSLTTIKAKLQEDA